MYDKSEIINLSEPFFLLFDDGVSIFFFLMCRCCEICWCWSSHILEMLFLQPVSKRTSCCQKHSRRCKLSNHSSVLRLWFFCVLSLVVPITEVGGFQYLHTHTHLGLMVEWKTFYCFLMKRILKKVVRSVQCCTLVFKMCLHRLILVQLQSIMTYTFLQMFSYLQWLSNVMKLDHLDGTTEDYHWAAVLVLCVFMWSWCFEWISLLCLWNISLTWTIWGILLCFGLLMLMLFWFGFLMFVCTLLFFNSQWGYYASGCCILLDGLHLFSLTTVINLVPSW